MDLVINKVVELQHINIAHGHLAVETIARTAVEQVYLARTVKSGEFQHVRNVRLTRTVEHRRCHRHRSEEHTSELQSLMRISYAVFCLKKKNNKNKKKQAKHKSTT